MKIPPWVWLLGGIALIAALSVEGPTAASYIMNAWESSSNGRKWQLALSNAEKLYNIPAGLLSRIAYQESHFVQSIIDGTQPSPAGALGMMQLLPRYFDTVQRPTPFSDQDTQDQVIQAAQLLSNLYTHFGDWTAATAAYNAGQKTISDVIAGTYQMPAETANYIAQISADLPGVVSPDLSA